MTALAILLALAAPASAEAQKATAEAQKASIAAQSAGTRAEQASADAQGATAAAAAAARAAQEIEDQTVQLRRDVEALAAARDEMRQKVADLEAKAAAAPPAPSPAEREKQALAGHDDDGFFMRSVDGGVLLRPSGLLQGLYEGELVGKAPTQQAAPDTSRFLVRRAELGVDGHLWASRLRYRLRMQLAGPGRAQGGPYLQDAYAEWAMRPTVALRVGQGLEPFGFQRPLPNGRSDLVDRAVATEAFSLGRDLGAWVVGAPLRGRLQYQLGVSNGASPNRCQRAGSACAAAVSSGGAMQNGAALGAAAAGFPNDNIDLAYVMRVVAMPFGPLAEEEGDRRTSEHPLLAVGGSVYWSLVPTDVRARRNQPNANVDVDGDGRVDNVSAWQAAGELRVAWRGAALQAEYFWRREDPGIVDPDRKFQGAYLQASTFVVPHRLQLAARGGRSDLPQYGVTFMARSQRGSRTDEGAGAVSYLIDGQNAKLQVDYTYLADHDAQFFDDDGASHLFKRQIHRLRAQLQLAF